MWVSRQLCLKPHDQESIANAIRSISSRCIDFLLIKKKAWGLRHCLTSCNSPLFNSLIKRFVCYCSMDHRPPLPHPSLFLHPRPRCLDDCFVVFPPPLSLNLIRSYQFPQMIFGFVIVTIRWRRNL